MCRNRQTRRPSRPISKYFGRRLHIFRPPGYFGLSPKEVRNEWTERLGTLGLGGIHTLAKGKRKIESTDLEAFNASESSDESDIDSVQSWGTVGSLFRNQTPSLGLILRD